MLGCALKEEVRFDPDGNFDQFYFDEWVSNLWKVFKMAVGKIRFNYSFGIGYYNYSFGDLFFVLVRAHR